MSNKQSSIDFLYKKMTSLNFDYLTSQITNKEFNNRSKVILEQAKEKHGNEVRDAFYIGRYEYNNFDSNSTQYYNETYGGNNG